MKSEEALKNIVAGTYLAGLAGLIGLVAAGLGTFNSFRNFDYLEGIVTRQSYVRSCSRPSYVLQVRTSKGMYTIDVREYGKPLEALAERIKAGDTVRFPTKRPVSENPFSPNYFSEDRIGSVRSSLIHVLD